MEIQTIHASFVLCGLVAGIKSFEQPVDVTIKINLAPDQILINIPIPSFVCVW